MVIMMCRLALACSFVVVALVHTSAQDPTKTLPDAYKVQLENDWVRVVRVHYDAGAKLPEHEHAAGTTVYVYLNDSDGVVFRHSGRSNRAVTRPAVKAGSARVSTGQAEHHTAENPASTPSDFLRIWLKTNSAGERTMRRMSANDDTFENKQLRITRVRVPAGQSHFIEATEAPALWVSIPMGTTQWLNVGQTEKLAVPGEGAAEYLRIDLLTPPK
jgi:hypothetical protein